MPEVSFGQTEFMWSGRGVEGREVKGAGDGSSVRSCAGGAF